MRKIVISIITFMLAAGFVVPPVVATSATEEAFELYITELQVGYAHNSSQEFIEIYNSSDQNAHEVTLEYAAGSAGDWQTAAVLAVIDIRAKSTVIISQKDYISDAEHYFTAPISNNAGAIRVVHDSQAKDCFRWGNMTHGDEAQFANCHHFPAPPKDDQSIQRQQQVDNLRDPDIFSPLTPGGITQITDTADDNETDGQNEEKPSDSSSDDPPAQKRIIITELFSDPAPPKSDSDHEFIEIYNPNDFVVNLKDYQLQTGNQWQYTYTLPDITIAAHEYLALYASETKLTLSNSGSRAQLLDTNGDQVSASDPYISIGQDISWSIINNKWQTSTAVTAGKANVLKQPVGGLGGTEDKKNNNLKPCRPDQFRNPATNRCKKRDSSDNALKPCASDQVRNPQTNRCKRLTDSVNDLKSCREDQFRNPETNRCKKRGSDNNNLKPCKPGQERNPATNRCRKVNQDNGLKPCDPGEERNPETNRCRKVETAAGILDDNNNNSTPPVNLGYIIGIASAAGAYALFQYRQDIGMLWWRLRQRLLSN